MIDNPSPSERRIATMQSVQNGHAPQFIYKYAGVDSAKIILKDSTLKFNPHTAFNDPFDCQFDVNLDSTYEDIFTLLSVLFLGKLSFKEIEYAAREVYENPLKKYDFAVNYLKNSIKKSGLCCFSKNSDNILMWSHYADKHSGLCLKFDILEDLECFSVPITVTYQDQFPCINVIKETGNILLPLITKSKFWEYEEEVRVYKSNGADTPAFEKAALKEIIFGCNADRKHIQEIRAIVQEKNYPNVTFKQAKIKKGYYALDILPL